MIVEQTKQGRATAMALAKFGEVTVGGPEWPDFVHEIGEDDQTVADALHRLRFRGYCSFTIVEHPAPPVPYCPWTRRYEHTGKELPPEIVPRPSLGHHLLGLLTLGRWNVRPASSPGAARTELGGGSLVLRAERVALSSSRERGQRFL